MTLIKGDPGITDNTVRAFEAMTCCLDGLDEREAINAAVNTLARVLMVQAPTKAHALRWAREAIGDVKHSIHLNWPNVEDARVHNGGRQPRVGGA